MIKNLTTTTLLPLLFYSIGVSKHMYYLVIGVSIIIIIVMSLLLKNSSRSLKNLAHLSVMRNVYFPVTIFG